MPREQNKDHRSGLHIFVSLSLTYGYAATKSNSSQPFSIGCFSECLADSRLFKQITAFLPPLAPFCSHIPPNNNMRLVEDTQFQLGQVPIDEIQFDPKCRDDIPAVLRGLQGLYKDETARTKIFEILEK